MKKKSNNRISLTLFIIVFLISVFSACSSRKDSPSISEDSTIVYSPKEPDGISTNIVLCRKIGGRTGKRIGKGTVFTITDDAKVHAFFDLENRENFINSDLMFHVEWIDSNSISFYRKQIDLPPDDSSSTINSSISISPQNRQPGIYKVRFFLFRELIAEKKFELRKEVVITGKEFDITANISLCSKIIKKNGKKIGAGQVFTIKKGAKVTAVIDLGNRDNYLNNELKFNVEWIGPDSNSFFSKKIDLPPGDSSANINSSVTITPENRQPGNYICRVFLYKTLLAEKRFELRKEVVITGKEFDITANISLSRKIIKKTGKLIGIDTVFTIKENSKVNATIDLGNRNEYSNKVLKFNVEWIGPDSKSFYNKKIDLPPSDSSSTIVSSISITPGKRQPGNYICRVYLFKTLLAEKTFELR